MTRLPRIRQLVISASDLQGAADTLCAVLDAQVAFRDDLSVFGLANVLISLGDSFLEVVSPIVSPPENTAAGRHMARCGGDCGYMVIGQVEDFDATAKHFTQHGIRTIWDIDRSNHGVHAKAAHLHPTDVPGAILSLDQMSPAAEWQWVGEDWRQHPCADPKMLFTGCGFASADPAALAERWSKALGVPVTLSDGAAELQFGDTSISFASREYYGLNDDSVPHRLAAFHLHCTDVASVLARAKARGLETAEGSFTAYGVRFELKAA